MFSAVCPYFSVSWDIIFQLFSTLWEHPSGLRVRGFCVSVNLANLFVYPSFWIYQKRRIQLYSYLSYNHKYFVLSLKESKIPTHHIWAMWSHRMNIYCSSKWYSNFLNPFSALVQLTFCEKPDSRKVHDITCNVLKKPKSLFLIRTYKKSRILERSFSS